jgi:hypothetical protein
MSELEGRVAVWTLFFPSSPPKGPVFGDEGRQQLKAPRKRAGGRT